MTPAIDVPDKYTPHIMIVAGEPSGDALGAQLMASLKTMTQADVRISGVGGPLMEQEGLASLFSLDDTAVMGLREVIPRIPLILKRVREAARFAIQHQPDAIVLVDAPDFTHRIGRRLAKQAPDLTVIKYVAPQVWASRPGRAKKLGEFIDHLLALLPFEPAFFEKYGLNTTFVGHPVVERPYQSGARDKFRRDHQIADNETVLGVLPGSRSNEIRFLMPVFVEVARQLCRRHKNLKVIIPAVPHVADDIRAHLTGLDSPCEIIENLDEKFAAFEACDVALAASGTVSTELAIARVPMVIAYRVGFLTAVIARRFITAKYVTLINIIRDQEVIPEFLQERCTVESLCSALEELIGSPAKRQDQLTQSGIAIKEMGFGAARPSDRAADAVLDVIRRKRVED